jgi:hypothetical protein
LIRRAKPGIMASTRILASRWRLHKCFDRNELTRIGYSQPATAQVGVTGGRPGVDGRAANEVNLRSSTSGHQSHPHVQ